MQGTAGVNGTSNDTATSKDLVDVVIYGATPAGLYAGLRLLEKIGNIESQLRADLFPTKTDQLLNQTNTTNQTAVASIKVLIYDPSNRVGGRLLTGTPPDIANFLAEMGDISYPSFKDGLTDFVVGYLGLETEEVPTAEANNLLHLRGNYMRMANVASQAQDFYALSFTEKNTTPASLLQKAIEMIIPNAFSLNDTAWEKAYYQKFNGEYLFDLGFLNILSQILSNEGIQYVKDSISMDSYFVNHNALDVIKSIVEMSKASALKKPVDGMQSIASGLADRFVEGGGEIILDRVLVGINKEANLSDVLGSIPGDSAVLGNFTNVAGNGLEPLVLEFTDSKGNMSEMVMTRFLILAVPPEQLSQKLMQTSPFFEELSSMEGFPNVEYVPNSKLYLCYDSPWWQTLGLVKGQSVTDIPIRSTQYLESGCIAATLNDGLSTPYWMALQPTNSSIQSRYLGDPGLLWDSVQAPAFMIRDAQRQLLKVHNLAFIPNPVTSAFVDSMIVGNGNHFYKVGVNPLPASKESLKPLTDWNVFVAGEAYFFPRMFLESDFRSAEELLQVYFFEKPQVSQYDPNAVIIVENRTRIGSSMSVSSDGARLAAVSYGDDGGDVTVFQYHGDPRVGKWSPIGKGFTSDYQMTVSQNVTSIKNRLAMNESIVNVALSGDGNTLALGVVHPGDKFGYVQVFYDFGNGNWTKIGVDLTSDAMDSSFGASLALSYKGDMLAIGAPDFKKKGRVTVYECSLFACQRFGLSMDGFAAGDQFGASVSISSLGDKVAIGAPTNPETPGYAAVFEYYGQAWRQRGMTLLNGQIGDSYGWAVSLSGDGNTFAVGAPNASGEVFVYSYDGEWVDISLNLTVSGGYAADEVGNLGAANTTAEAGNLNFANQTYDVGYSLALSGDGKYLIVGVPQIDSNSTGFAVVYQHAYGLWLEHGDVLTGTMSGGQKGYSVAINVDGSVIALGAPGTGDTGAIRTYSFVEQPTSPFEALAREIWANATSNLTVDYSWSPFDPCILTPELMANNGTMMHSLSVQSINPPEESSAPATSPATTGTLAPTSSTFMPTESNGTGTSAPTPLSLNATAVANSSRLLLDNGVFEESIANLEREIQEVNITEQNVTAVAIPLSTDNTTEGLPPPDVLSNNATAAPARSRPTASAKTTSRPTASENKPLVTSSGNPGGSDVNTTFTADATEYYVALAEGIKNALENNLTTADVANALLFMEGSSSTCLSLQDAAKFYSTSDVVPQDLRSAMGLALEAFASRAPPTAPPVAVATKAPVKVLPTKPPVLAPATSLAPAPSAQNGTSTLAPTAQNGTTLAPFGLNATTLSPIASNATTFNGASFKILYVGLGWIGLGVSELGSMVGSVAAIGVPPENTTNVKKYNLNSKTAAGVVPMDSSMQTLKNVAILQSDTRTVMRFETLLDWNNGVLSFNPTSNTQMIYAYGKTNTLDYHGPTNRGAILYNLAFCLDGANAEDVACQSNDPLYDQMQMINSNFTIYSKLINM